MLLPSDKDEDFDRGEVLLQRLQLNGDLEEGLAFKTKLSDVMSKAKANANPSGSIIFQIHCFLSKRMYLVDKARICRSLGYLLVLSWTSILVVKYKNFLKKKGESGRVRMTSNCIASSIFGEIK